QLDGEGRPAVIVVRRHNSSAVLPYDPLRDRQAEAGAATAAGRVSAVEPVEDARLRSGWETRTVVGHGELNLGPPLLHRDPDLPFVRRELDRVVEEDPQQLREQIG